MFTWSTTAERGKRASDNPKLRMPPPHRDMALEKAIAEDSISVLFQPQIEPGTGFVIGAEALARWDGGPGPEELFARAAALGLAERLSRTVQSKALRQAAQWQEPLSDLRLAINLLPDELAREGYVEWLLDEIDSVGMDPARITAEITENVLLPDQAIISERLTLLRQAGLSIAVDDFGTGYSNLAYLASLPLDALKIDRAMIAEIVGGTRHRIVVRAMIGLARELDLKVIVEGVESTEQLRLLVNWGCDLYQGFLGAGALDSEELARFVTASRMEIAS